MNEETPHYRLSDLDAIIYSFGLRIEELEFQVIELKDKKPEENIISPFQEDI